MTRAHEHTTQPPTSPAPAAAGPRDPLPADASWAHIFGSPTLAHDPFAVAVDGTHVYVGGNFYYDMAGMVAGTYNRIAWWDGHGWRRMGEGCNAAVRAIVVVGGHVYVGGDFTVAGGVAASHLARWDGGSWQPVAGGVAFTERPGDATVRALASDGTTLYVGGTFTRAGDATVRSLAALDLATGTWSDAGTGVELSWSAEPGAVHALALSGGDLYVGGSFDLAGGSATASLARLDPVTGAWTTFGAGITDDGLSGTVSALAVDPVSGDVIVGGRFTDADVTPAWNLAVLGGGAFRTLGDVSNNGGQYAHVHAIAVAGRLYIGGQFTAVGNAEAAYWACHDGTTWSVPGEGVDSAVWAMAATADGAVVVVGDFAASGRLRVVHGGTWTPAGWRSFGQGLTSDQESGGTVSAVVPVGGGAFVGGLFDQAGHLPVRSVAHWTGEAWDDMAGGVGATFAHGQVFAMLRLGTDLYVAGRFDTAGDTVVNNIARWDGAAWARLGDGVDGAVYAMALLGGRLYVGGAFNRAGGTAASHLASWDPATATWSAVGNNPTYDDDIRALAVIGDQWLVIGGDFHRFFAAGLPVMDDLYGMTLFDTAKPPTGDALSGYRHIPGASRYGGTGMINALQVIGDDCYVGGWFDAAGILVNGPRPRPGFPAANLAVWHLADDTWEAVDGTDAQVHALADVDGALAVGGRFTTAGDVAASRVAILDRAGVWRPLGSGLGDGGGGYSWAYALAFSGETGLWVGGEFPDAGAAPSANLALWMRGE